MAMYGKVEYWDARYKATEREGPYEWYHQSYKTLKHLLTPESLKPASIAPVASPDTAGNTGLSPPVSTEINKSLWRVLIVGCGNAPFGEDMIHDGWYGPIVNVDFSRVVIEQMNAKYSGGFYDSQIRNATPATRMQFICADTTQRLPFAEKSFDLIICKATLDAILCSPGSVHSARAMIEECHRLLVNGTGVLFLVTPANPDARIVFLERDNWGEISTHTVKREDQPKSDYVYICRKRFAEPVSPATKTEESTEYQK